jgi:hypothetical protein
MDKLEIKLEQAGCGVAAGFHPETAALGGVS